MTARDIARTFDVRRADALERARLTPPTADDTGRCTSCSWPVEELVWLDDQLVCVDCFLNLTAEADGEVAA